MDLVALLRGELDEGEAEAIALCREQSVDIVLLDEKDARKAARRLGLTTIGTVGVLIWAKRTGLVGSLREQLDALRTRGRFRLGEAVYEQALQAVGEGRS
jgi:predicted nucleic acid-binding protein